MSMQIAIARPVSSGLEVWCGHDAGFRLNGFDGAVIFTESEKLAAQTIALHVGGDIYAVHSFAKHDAQRVLDSLSALQFEAA